MPPFSFLFLFAQKSVENETRDNDFFHLFFCENSTNEKKSHECSRPSFKRSKTSIQKLELYIYIYNQVWCCYLLLFFIVDK